MPVLTIDFETYRDEEISLKKMTLRNYLKAAPVIGVAFQEDGAQAVWLPVTDPAFMEWIEDVRKIAEDPDWIIQGHNGAGFDARVLRFGRISLDTPAFDLPWPTRVHDSMELAMAAWPCQPGGYSLKNLSEWLHLPPKLSLEDAEKGRISWDEYCTRDCSNSWEIYRRAIQRVSPDELFVSEMANRVRGMHFEVSAEQVAKSFADFQGVTNEAVRAIFEHTDAQGNLTLGDDAEALFGKDGDEIRSVKAPALKRILLERLGFDTHSTSLKKINPTKLAHAPEVGQILLSARQANRGIYYRRRARDLQGISALDMELGYARATNTLRYSSPSCGRSANLHSLAKRDLSVAKPLRQMLTLPEDLCFVRADAANVEYRCEGLLTNSTYIKELFETNINADPYAAFALQAFGVKVEKKGPTAPLRQLAKNAVLGLGFCLASGTPVLTSEGWKPIETITPEDVLWTGKRWTKSGGAVKMGTKLCCEIGPIWSTPDHRFLCTDGWRSAGEIATSGGTLRPLSASAWADGRSLRRSSTGDPSAVYLCAATAAERAMCVSIDWSGASQLNAAVAQTDAAAAAAGHPANTLTSLPMRVYVGGGEPAGGTPRNGAWTPTTPTTPTTAGEGSGSSSPTAGPSSPTSSLSQGGMTGGSNSTEPTPTGTTPPGTCEWSTLLRKHGIPVRVADVWDILDAGEDACFQAGPFIAHNCMGLVRWMEEMNKTLSDPTAGVTLGDVRRICDDKRWSPPTKAFVKGAQTRTNSPWEIASVAYETREAFHRVHHEFFSTAFWLERTVQKVSGALDPERTLDACYELDGAPDRNLIDLSIDRDLEYPSVRVTALGWSMPTVTWRHLSVAHPGIDGLGAVTSNKGPRKVYKAIFIENITQSAARCMMVKAKLELEKRGWPVIMSVHDEIMLIVPRERTAVLKAREDLAEVMGPALGFRFAFYAKRADICVSASMWEDEDDSKARWPKIEAGTEDCFLHLP